MITTTHPSAETGEAHWSHGECTHRRRDDDVPNHWGAPVAGHDLTNRAANPAMFTAGGGGLVVNATSTSCHGGGGPGHSR